MENEKFKHEAIGCGVGVISTAVICSLLNVSKQKLLFIIAGGAILGTLIGKHISENKK